MTTRHESSTSTALASTAYYIAWDLHCEDYDSAEEASSPAKVIASTDDANKCEVT